MLNTDINSAGFNSYASVDDCRQFAINRGLLLPNEDEKIIILLNKAMDYLETLNWKGSPTDKAQPLSWPRKDIVKDSRETPSNSIPKQIIDAQCYLAINSNDIDFLPVIPGGEEVLSESIAGTVSITYAPKSKNDLPKLPFINRLLNGFCYSSNTAKICRG
ncbi:hypothetical protein GQ597_11280 [Gilliamella sp. Pra-s65]|uniref:DnaT-like ssDNA-binding protein n=1 Tax=unclassified Gilliamella TaxID=2685620 RepID=UPI001365E78A|nr:MULTISPECIES: DnaT-like ssDNA-binding protein [unclassified Gilliamella]MWN91281.1 hypothetical protein [Gilliamella sp. Pra-s65]MWP74257.1 hypothetical protein [Gilliamella sp. Pra-s52]